VGGGLAFKAIRQNYSRSIEVASLMEVFTRMTNDCIIMGLVNNLSSLRKLSLLCYNQLGKYDSPSYYKLCAISRAAGILASRKKSLKRGFRPKSPYAVKPELVSCYGFKIRNGLLEIPVARGRRFGIPLTNHTLHVISRPGVKVRSFTLTCNSLSLCISRDVPVIRCLSTVGVDRNLRNLTVGNDRETRQYDLSETVRIARVSTDIVASFKRNDVRIRSTLFSKHGARRAHRVSHLLHNVTKRIVGVADEQRTAIVLENIEGIRSLYRKGNGQGRKYRGRMNCWSFGEAQRQIEYKARWFGLPVIRLSKGDTRGSSVACPRCGERLQSDKRLGRKLWCGNCRIVMDRDRVAAVNLARRGRLRFDRSQPKSWAQGPPGEAMVEEPEPVRETVILKVDGGKIDSHEHNDAPKGHQNHLIHLEDVTDG